MCTYINICACVFRCVYVNTCVCIYIYVCVCRMFISVPLENKQVCKFHSKGSSTPWTCNKYHLTLLLLCLCFMTIRVDDKPHSSILFHLVLYF